MLSDLFKEQQRFLEWSLKVTPAGRPGWSQVAPGGPWMVSARVVSSPTIRSPCWSAFSSAGASGSSLQVITRSRGLDEYATFFSFQVTIGAHIIRLSLHLSFNLVKVLSLRFVL